MGSFQETGTLPGQVAKGEYGNDALLTSRGQIVVCNSAGVPVALARPAAGLFLGSDGSDIIGRYPPGYLLANDHGATVTSNAETTLLSAGAISGGFPAGVAVGDTVEIKAWGNYESTGASNVLTLNLYMGATQLGSIAFPSANSNASRKAWMFRATVEYAIIAGAGSGAVRPGIDAAVSSAGGFPQGLVSAGGWVFNDATAVTVATNAAATVDLKSTLSSGTATIQVVCNLFQARYYPKNY